MMTVINNKAIIAACTEFGARIGEQLDSREGDAFDIAFKACLRRPRLQAPHQKAHLPADFRWQARLPL